MVSIIRPILIKGTEAGCGRVGEVHSMYVQPNLDEKQSRNRCVWTEGWEWQKVGDRRNFFFRGRFLNSS